jgi:hypothetical protein
LSCPQLKPKKGCKKNKIDHTSKRNKRLKRKCCCKKIVVRKQFVKVNIPQGASGAVGAVGSAGSVGAAGTVGTAGTVGSAGAVGPAGAVGTAGTVGAAGTVGTAGTVGATGATGPAGPSGIVDVRFTESNDPVPFVSNPDETPFAMTELALPPIVLAPNQVVKLDAFANINFLSVQSYQVNSFISRNPTDIITIDDDAIIQAPGQPNFEQVTVTTSISWVDNPGPGTYLYTYTIIALAPFGISEGSINSRNITAMVINTN